MAVSPTFHKARRWLPSFLNRFSDTQLKTFFRCWVAVWVASLLMFIQPVLSNFGADVFFACVAIFIIPPSEILFVYILGVLTIWLGVFLAWAWGVITLKAAYAARSNAETQALLASLQQAVGIQAQATGQPGDAISQRLIFDGWMLDTRVTVITYCMICPFIYLMARLRAANEKATLAFVFSMLIIDSFLCIGPLLPEFDGLLPLPLVKPTAVGLGIGLACTFLFFPQSTVDNILEGINDVVEDLKAPLQFSFATSSLQLCKADIERLAKSQAKVIAGFRKLEPSFAFLPLDFSVGCWGADVVKAFEDSIQRLVRAVLALSEFHHSSIQTDIQFTELRRQFLDSSGEALGLKKASEERFKEVGSHQRAQLAELANTLYEQDHSTFEELATKLRQTGLTATEGCLEGLNAIQESLQFVRQQHWYNKASAAEHDQAHQRIQTVLAALRETRKTFLREMTEKLEEVYDPLFDDFAADKSQPSNLSGVIIFMNFQEHMVDALTRIEVVLEQISSHFSTARRIRPWFPTRLNYAVAWALKERTGAPISSGASTKNPEKLERNETAKAAKGKGGLILGARSGYRPIARHPAAKVILGLYHWLTCDEGIYALRVVIITIAISIPAVLPNTAGFYFREKGLWALVTAQLGLGIYIADFTFSTFGPAAGTMAGGILGLLGWYMGSGSGPGNPYGLAAVCAIFLIPLLAIRLSVSPDNIPGGALVAVTFLMIIMYSYVDRHFPTYGDPGVGYTVFWRRVLLILIGSAASIIVQIFPHPPSAAHHVCKSLSRSVRTLSDHYALLLSSWTYSQADTRALVEPIWMDLTQTLHGLIGPIFNLRFEFSSSRFDSTTLEQIRQLHHHMNNNLARLLVTSAALPREYQDQLAQMTGMHDHRCIGEIMAVLGICEQALRTGDAPPEVLPTPLVRRALDYGRSHQQTRYVLSKELIRDKDYQQYCVALAAYIWFLARVDDLVLVIKGALGESHLVTYELPVIDQV